MQGHRYGYPANHTGLFLLQRCPLIMVSVFICETETLTLERTLLENLRVYK